MQIQGSVLLAKEFAEDGLCMYSEAGDHERVECGAPASLLPQAITPSHPMFSKH